MLKDMDFGVYGKGVDGYVHYSLAMERIREEEENRKGADASALCFSVIETAKRNKLDSFGYLRFLLQELPKLGNEPTREQLLPLLPWSTALTEYCHLS